MHYNIDILSLWEQYDRKKVTLIYYNFVKNSRIFIKLSSMMTHMKVYIHTLKVDIDDAFPVIN